MALHPLARCDRVVIDQENDLSICGSETGVLGRDDTRLCLMDYFQWERSLFCKMLRSLLGFHVVGLPDDDNLVRQYCLSAEAFETRNQALRPMVRGDDYARSK